MSASNRMEKWDMRFLIHALTAWGLSAIVGLLVASLLVQRAGIGMGGVGYVSSAVSFITALFAGAAAIHSRKQGGLYVGLLTAAAITTILLTIGFLIDGSELESSGVLSVVTFTFSGCLVGSVFLGRKTSHKKTRFDPKRRQ